MAPFIAGRYSVTWDPPGAGTGAVDVGIVERGYELQLSYSKKLITNTDAYADAVIDAIYRGANVFWQTTCLEYKAGSLNPAFPYGSIGDGVFLAYAPTGATYMSLGVIGRLDSNVAGVLIATSTTATPAVSTPATLTATYSLIAENFNVNLLFGPEERKVPMRMRFYPYLDTVLKFFTATAVFLSSLLAVAASCSS